MTAKRTCLGLAGLLLLAGTRLGATESVTLFRVFLNDGTAVVSYGEIARVGDRVVFSMPIGVISDSPSIPPNLHVVNIPAAAVDWTATSNYAESARFAHYVATTADADYAALTGEVAGVLNSIMFTKDPKRQLSLAMEARRRLAPWPREHFGYRSEDVRQVLGLLDEVISELRASAGETAFSVDLVAVVEPPRPAPVMANPRLVESIAQAIAVAKVSDVPADRVAILQSIVAVIDDPHNAARSWAWPARRWAVAAIDEETATDGKYARLTTASLQRVSAAAAQADVREAERVLSEALRKDAELGRRRHDVMEGLLAEIHAHLDAARKLQFARDRWRERVGSYRAYEKAVAPVLETLEAAQRHLGDIKSLAGSAPAVLMSLNDRLHDSAQRLAVLTVPDDLKAAHALLQSALNLADNAIKTRRQAVMSGELNVAWDASSAAAGSMLLFAKAREDMEATVQLPHIR